jgi:hypothetical protein
VTIRAPKAPPTAGTTTRTRSGSMPRTSATVSRTQNGAWQGAYSSRPSPVGTATAALGSSGDGATRWFTNRARTSTSAPSRARVGSGQRRSLARLPPSANSRGASAARAASGSVTTGSGS